MSAYLDDREYLDRIRDMVLVDVAPDDQFAVTYGGEVLAVHDDIINACDHAAEMAASRGCKWDVTLHASNAGDMS